MRYVALVAVAALLGVGGCATLTGGEENAPAPAFNAAACVQKDFVIYFDDGRAELTDEARRIIDLQARDIRGCTIDGVQIIGLSDQDEGNAESSRQLSVRRAEVLAEYLATRASWPRSRFELLATGARGAVTAEGLDVPVRNRARIIVAAHAP
ncbi:MAG: OmpA family protein [Hyphomonadaceae bacterium]|nr:OmpA family protein [Hyphomonadaceae bacterium]